MAIESKYRPENQIADDPEAELAALFEEQKQRLSPDEAGAALAGKRQLSNIEGAQAKSQIDTIEQPRVFLNIEQADQPKSFKQRLADRRIRLIIADATTYEGKIRLGEDQIHQLATNLSTEQLRRFPEIIISARDQLVTALAKLCEYPDINSGKWEDIDQVFSFFSAHPVIIDELLHDGEVLSWQDQIFSSYFLSPGTQHLAPGVVNKLHMDPRRARQLAWHAISETINHPERRDHQHDGSYVFNINQGITDFHLEEEAKERLVATKVLIKLKSDYPWQTAEDFREEYNLSTAELQEIVRAHEPEMQEVLRQAALRIPQDPEIIIRFYGSYQREFGLLNTEWFEQQPQSARVMAVTRLITREQGHGLAFTLLDRFDWSDEARHEISQSIFSSPEKFDYLCRLGKLYQAEPAIMALIIETLLRKHDSLSDKTPEQVKAYVKISQQISESPVQEIVRLKDDLINQVLSTDNPEEVYEAISNIFVRNNLPTIGKLFQVFEILNPPGRVQQLIHNHSSPVLQQASTSRRRRILFEDLLRVHVAGGNRSLENFLQILQVGSPLIERQHHDPAALSENEQQQLWHILKKFKTVVDVSLRDQRNLYPALSTDSLVTAYEQLYLQLGVKDGQTMAERVVEMYARPLGFSNVPSVVEAMQRDRINADKRGRSLVEKGFCLEAGDLIKGSQGGYLENQLQNGLVAKEFLGAGSDSDLTPLDTDVEMFQSPTTGSLAANYQNIWLAKGYGDILFIIKDRGQFQRTTADQRAKYDRSQYELFAAGVWGESHYGIRTGIPATEVDFIILNAEFNSQQRQHIYYSIAQNGYYMPIVEKDGSVAFTPEMFDEYRKIFAGIERFNGGPLNFVSSAGESYADELQVIKELKKSDADRLVGLKKEVRSLVVEVLSEFGIQLKDEHDESLAGAELLDVGSTGRGTNVGGEGDFDLTLKLDASDYDKVRAIGSKIIQRLGAQTTQSASFARQQNNYLLRFFGTNVLSEKGIDIDIVFVRKSDVNMYASQDAIGDKLDSIGEHYGAGAYEEAIANILLAKHWLKEAEVYKKGAYAEGGLGGIGVENLVLAYGGNVGKAFKTFYDAARGRSGTIKPFEQFKKDFKLLDAGMNLRSNQYDNFIDNMTEQGYQKMLRVVQDKFPEVISNSKRQLPLKQ